MSHLGFDKLIRLIALGDTGVGKTAFLRRLTSPDSGVADVYVPTIGVDFMQRLFTVRDKRVQLQCWDTAGQERYHAVTASFLRQKDIVLLCFSVAKPQQSLRSLDKWLAMAEVESPNAVFLLVGTHLDRAATGYFSAACDWVARHPQVVDMCLLSNFTDRGVTACVEQIKAMCYECKVPYYVPRALRDGDTAANPETTSKLTQGCCTLL